MPGLSAGDGRYRDDDGSADPRVAAALAAFAAGEGSEQAALTALAASRLLVPLVTTMAGGDPAGGEKVSEIALPTLVGRDGRTALPVFTSLAALSRWRPGARPVPRAAELVWQAAVRDSHAVMIDVAGPVPLPVEGARLAALARGEPVPPPHLDPDVKAAVAALAARHPAILGARLGPGQDGTDLLIQLTLRSGGGTGAGGAGRELAAAFGAEVMSALGGRLRRGAGVAVPSG